MLLGFILEDAAPARRGPFAPRRSIRRALAAVRAGVVLHAEPLTFNPPRAWRPQPRPPKSTLARTAARRRSARRELLGARRRRRPRRPVRHGAPSARSPARCSARSPANRSSPAERRCARSSRAADVPGSSRALGWDTMLPTSSCGTLMSPTAIGHTGFTGTSLWIDWERDLYVVLLTNHASTRHEKNDSSCTNLALRSDFRPTGEKELEKADGKSPKTPGAPMAIQFWQTTSRPACRTAYPRAWTRSAGPSGGKAGVFPGP